MGLRFQNLWAYNAAADNALMDVCQFLDSDVANATFLTSFEPDIPNLRKNGRGVAMILQIGIFGVSSLGDGFGTGDRFIHKFPGFGGP